MFSLDDHDFKRFTAKIVELFDRFCSAKIKNVSELTKYFIDFVC